jgi:hypothetical protein
MKWLVAASASASFGRVLRAADSQVSEIALPVEDGKNNERLSSFRQMPGVMA